MNYFSKEAYHKAIRNIIINTSPIIKEYEEINEQHIALNGKLEKLFKNVERLGKISRWKAVYYCIIRTKNDVINSKLKILSTKTNDANIEIQNIHSAFIQQSNKTKIIYKEIDKPRGRLNFHLEWE